MANVMDNSEEKRDEWFNFLWNRTRAIRKVSKSMVLAYLGVCGCQYTAKNYQLFKVDKKQD